VKNALDIKETARNDDQIDRAIEGATDTIEGDLNRKFFPEVDTRYFDWPNQQYAEPWRLWLEENEVTSVTSFTAGGVVISAANYNLEPNEAGPPYDHIEAKRNTIGSFTSSTTPQRDIALAGIFGATSDTSPCGATAEPLDNSETDVDVTNSFIVGVGDLIKVDSEQMLVTDKSMLDTGQVTGGALTAAANDVTVAVTTGSAYFKNEIIQINSEQMLITSITGNNLTVKRAWNGSVLATHLISTAIYAPRTLTVIRAMYGTTVATHLTTAPLVKNKVPGVIKNYAIAESINTFLQETAGYTRTVGSGEGVRNASGAGLRDMRDRAYLTWGRKARIAAV
jgi:hypothetical protein